MFIGRKIANCHAILLYWTPSLITFKRINPCWEMFNSDLHIRAMCRKNESLKIFVKDLLNIDAFLQHTTHVLFVATS